ncbi:acyl-ACP desaturase [Nocardia asteroides]|uniref:acyl-ACP desaturase n=1 Tax=Nocardia asteroides TaxID=1824 RepID=UPI001E617D0A|nr:acyl-ACP desaturase [Nocardia asteroides]UGT62430.1 acyl-ACP desaturase [Nocardia asteroides]
MPTDRAIARDLEPVAGRALRDHLRKARKWDPDEHRPRGRNIADRHGIHLVAPIPESDAGTGRMLTALALLEHDLPAWHRALCAAFGRDGAWGAWIGRWTAEQGRHAIVLRDYLIGTGIAGPAEFEAARLARADAGVRWPAADAGPLPALVYATLAHAAIRTAYRRVGARSTQPATERMLRRVAADENLHLIFFRDLTAAALALAPDAGMRAVAEVVAGFRPPHAALPGFGREAAIFAAYGGYDSTVHLTEVLLPTLRMWRVPERELGPDGERARAALNAYLGEQAARCRAGSALPLAAAG